MRKGVSADDINLCAPYWMFTSSASGALLSVLPELFVNLAVDLFAAQQTGHASCNLVLSNRTPVGVRQSAGALVLPGSAFRAFLVRSRKKSSRFAWGISECGPLAKVDGAARFLDARYVLVSRKTTRFFPLIGGDAKRMGQSFRSAGGG